MMVVSYLNEYLADTLSSLHEIMMTNTKKNWEVIMAVGDVIVVGAAATAEAADVDATIRFKEVNADNFLKLVYNMKLCNNGC